MSEPTPDTRADCIMLAYFGGQTMDWPNGLRNYLVSQFEKDADLRAQLAAVKRERDEARAERNVAIGKRDDMRHNWEQAEQAIAELVAGLKPFAAYAVHLDRDDDRLGVGYYRDPNIYVSDIRRAAALLAKYGAPQ